MANTQLMERLQPWLERWSVTDLSAAEGWLSNMSLGAWRAEEFLVMSGEHSDTLYLVEEGLVRLYYTNHEGRERNKGFYGAGQVTGPVSAAITGAAAPFSIQCLEDTQAICFRFRDLLDATATNPEIARLYRQLLAEAFIRNEQREAVLLTCNAEQRYRWLLDNEGELLERVPQFHIASYLGVDAVSLSRLKRKFRG